MRTKSALIVLSVLIWCLGAGSARAQQAAEDSRLDTLVSISYQDAAATDVLFALGRAGDLRTNMTTRPLSPVTVTLTNVKLRTALDAVCQNAGCYWDVERAAPQYGGILLMRVRALEEPLTSIPKRVTIVLKDTPVSTVLRVLAATLKVTLTLETDVPEVRSNFNLENADTSATLNLLCESKLGNCAWELNERSRTLRIFPRK